MSFWKTLFIIFIFSFSLIDTQPNTCKRAGNFLDEHPTKRIKTLKNLQNPFQLKSCENSKNSIYLQKLANIKFSNEKVYGYHKENAETMFESQQCKIQSFNNDNDIFKSIETMSNLEFFNLVSSRKTLYKTILNVFAHHDKYNDKPDSHQKRFANIRSYKSYFIFTITQGMETIINKLKQLDFNKNFKNILSESEYQILKTNLIYVGAGQPSRPFDHVVQTNNILLGKYVNNPQKLHLFLARGVIQNQFSKIMIVSFFGSNHYPAVLYSEQATAWVLRDHIINEKNHMELGKLKHKLCVEPSYPELYLKNCFSTQALQFVADYNVEAGIRQIGKFGKIVSLTNPKQEKVWENEVSFKTQPYIDSTFSVAKNTTLFYRFGLPFYDIKNINLATLNSKIPIELLPFAEKNYRRMFPFHKIDFVFKEGDWIERVRLANEIENNLVSILINKLYCFIIF